MAVADVRADDSDTNWLVFNYEGRGNGELALRDLGNDGLDGMLAAMPDGKVSFGLLRYEAGDQESRRIKFVGITYIAPGTPPLAKARVSMQKDACEKIFGQLHVQMLSDDLSDLAPDKVASKVAAAGGANYDTGSNAGGYKKSVVGAANGGGVRKPSAMPRGAGGGAAAEVDPAKQASPPRAAMAVDSSGGAGGSAGSGEKKPTALEPVSEDGAKSKPKPTPMHEFAMAPAPATDTPSATPWKCEETGAILRPRTLEERAASAAERARQASMAMSQAGATAAHRPKGRGTILMDELTSDATVKTSEISSQWLASHPTALAAMSTSKEDLLHQGDKDGFEGRGSVAWWYRVRFRPPLPPPPCAASRTPHLTPERQAQAHAYARIRKGSRVIDVAGRGRPTREGKSAERAAGGAAKGRCRRRGGPARDVRRRAPLDAAAAARPPRSALR